MRLRNGLRDNFTGGFDSIDQIDNLAPDNNTGRVVFGFRGIVACPLRIVRLKRPFVPMPAARVVVMQDPAGKMLGPVQAACDIKNLSAHGIVTLGFHEMRLCAFKTVGFF